MRLKIVPFGEIPQEILNAVSNELRVSFRIISEISDQMGLPKEYYNPYRHQYIAPKILDVLSEKFGSRVLAITDQDIFAEDLNFVFGQAQVNGRSAIISTHRLSPKFYREDLDRRLLAERAVKEAVHEVGHMFFGLKHCSDPDCVMCFSKTISDVDRKGKDICESCQLQIRL